jgi:hypothetical protein
VKRFKVQNYAQDLANIEAEFNAANPRLDFQYAPGPLTNYQRPQIVDTRYGQSMLFSKPGQSVALSNSTAATGGYTLKVWLCFTNYNALKQIKNEKSQVSGLIHVLTRRDLEVSYDSNRSVLTVVVLDADGGEYKSEVDFDLKVFVWYTLTLSWAQMDGLRVYVSGKLVGHVSRERRVTGDLGTGGLTIGRPLRSEGEASGRFRYELIVHRVVELGVMKYPDEVASKSPQRSFKG